MAHSTPVYRIFISAGELSGDMHCANLIKTLNKAKPGGNWVGVGGPKMEAAGCQLLETTVGKAAMLHNGFKEVAFYHGLLKRIQGFFRDNPVDLVIVCDSPAFNFHVAKAAKRAGIPVLFYVAPQLWAWGAWRIGKLRRCCDRLCCILPFEEQWFKERGVDASFVSNPLLDEITQDLSPNTRTYTAFAPTQLKLALMPGSRSAEIDTLWRPMQEIAVQLKKRYPQMRCVTVAANDGRQAQLQGLHLPGFDSDYAVDAVRQTARNADFTLVASGSACLEVATAGCPMVVMYQSSRILWHLIGRWVVKSPYLCLVNLLANRELVPEFMPYFQSVDPIVQQVCTLIENREQLAQTSRDLIEITQPLAEQKTCTKVAEIVLDMLSL